MSTGITSTSSAGALTTVSAEVAQDIRDLAFENCHYVPMMFYPTAWAKAPTTTHTWQSTDFPPDPRSLIPKQPGVYVFVVMTNLFGFPHANGLFYVGKATNLYDRVGAYMHDDNLIFSRTNRPLVWNMLNTWHGHLKYFYTTTVDVTAAEELENEMLNAFRPPFNRQYDATTSPSMRAFP